MFLVPLIRIFCLTSIVPILTVVATNLCSSTTQQLNIASVDGSFYPQGVASGATDGVYTYFLSDTNLGSPMGKLVRIPINGFSESNVQILDLGAIDPDLRGFSNGDAMYSNGFVYCGTLRYTWGSTYVGKIARVDVNNFSPSGVIVLDLTTVNTLLRGFFGLFTDGTYGYVVPGQTASGVSGGMAGRFLLSPFTTAGVNTIDLTAIDPSLAEFSNGFYDGRYSYLLGCRCIGGKIVRMDPLSFTQANVVVLDITGGYDSQIKHIISGFTYGSYNYFVAAGCTTPDIGKILRIPINNFNIAAITTLDLSTVDSQLIGFGPSFVDQSHAIILPRVYPKAARINLLNFTTSAVSIINTTTTTSGFVGFASPVSSCSYFASTVSAPTIIRVCNITCFDTYIDYCSPNPCLNGGTCVNGPSNYACTCSPLYTGVNCSTPSISLSWSLQTSTGNTLGSTLTNDRWCAGAAALNGKFYIAGGFAGFKNAVGLMEEYSPLTNQWSYVATAPYATFCPSLVSAAGNLWLISGVDNNFTPLPNMASYNPTTNTWTSLTVPTDVQGYPFASSLNNLIVVANLFSSAMRIYNTTSQTWSSLLPVFPNGVFARPVCYNGKIWAVGSDGIYSLDTSLTTWSLVWPLPSTAGFYPDDQHQSTHYVLQGTSILLTLTLNTGTAVYFDLAAGGSIQSLPPIIHTWGNAANSAQIDSTTIMAAGQDHVTIRGILAGLPPNYCSSNPCLNGGTCINGPFNYTCNCSPLYSGVNCSTQTGSVFGDPHFTGFNGVSFDFMGEHGRIYNLYSSQDLHINARFILSLRPEHYPQYEKPMFMDVITVQYGTHRAEWSTFNHPIVDSNSLQFEHYHHYSPQRIVIQPDDTFKAIYHSPKATMLTLHLGQSHPGVPQSSLYTINITRMNDDWQEKYMDISMSVDSYMNSNGLLGRTRSTRVSSIGNHTAKEPEDLMKFLATQQDLIMTLNQAQVATVIEVQPLPQSNLQWEEVLNDNTDQFQVAGDDTYGLDCPETIFGRSSN